ncbi:MAG: GYF domain-containing protein [Bdellovibrionaceae bacterium]|nr:GYF domain-containing protein [Pseudobdellovibrionaceae bacterium]
MNGFAQNKNWYILSGEEKIGPFSYGEMISLMQQGELQDYHYVWAPHMELWTLLGETPEFSPDRIARIYEKEQSQKPAFEKRQHERIDVKFEALAHNQQLLFYGECTSLSEGGALVYLNTPILLPKDEIVFHLPSNGELSRPISAKAQILRKGITRSKIHVRSGLQYAVRFLQLPDSARISIRELVDRYKGGNNDINSSIH